MLQHINVGNFLYVFNLNTLKCYLVLTQKKNVEKLKKTLNNGFPLFTNIQGVFGGTNYL